MDENIARELTETLRDLNDLLGRRTGLSSRSTTSNTSDPAERAARQAELKARLDYLTDYKNLTLKELYERRREIEDDKLLTETQKKLYIEQVKVLTKEVELRDKQNKALEQTGIRMISSLGNLGKAFNDISGDITGLNSHLNGLGDGAIELGKNFGKVGIAAGALTKAVTFFISSSLNQANTMLKAFDELSSVGGTARLTTEELRQLGKESGYSVDNLSKFTKNFVNLGTDLVGLGSTASLGAKAFAKMTQVGNSTYEAFNRLGVSQEQVTAAQSAYVKQSILGNQVLKKSPEELKKASLEYLDTLIKLREITGMTFEQQQASMEKAKSQENFNQYLANLTYKEIEIREKLTNATGEQKNILERELKSLENQRKQKEVIGMIAASIGGEEGTALLQAISTSGEVIQTELVAKLQHLKGIDIVGVVERIHRGEEALPYFFETIAKSGKQFSQQFGDLAAQLGGPGAEIRAVFGQNIELQKMALKYVSLTNEADRQKLIEDMKRVAEEQRLRKETGNILDDENKTRKDATKETQNTMLTTNRTLSTAIDDVRVALNPFTGSVLGATTAAVGLAGAAYLAIAGLRRLGTSGMLSGLGASGAGGALGRVIGTAVKFSPLAIAGTLGGTALGAAGDYLGSDTTAGKSLGVLGNAATGAGLGAMLGIPGAIAGGVLGAGYGIYDKFFGKTSNTVAPTTAATPAGSSATAATVSTVAQGGQQAVNVNIVGSIPLNVNIEKVLDPLFKLTRTPRQSPGMSEFSLADINDEITVPVKISAMSEGFENLFKSMNDNLYAIARNTKKDSTVSTSAPASAAGSGATGSSTQMNDSSGRQLTRAERNNNPGNLIFNEYTRGLGAVGQDNAGFAIFPTLEAGTNALQENLRNYRRTGVTQNVESIIEKWSPGKGQGNTQQGTDNYINFVAQQLGVKPNQPININDPIVMEKLTGSIAKFESGRELSNFRNPAAPAAAQPATASVSSTPASKKLLSIKDTVDLGVFREKDPEGHREYVQRYEELRREHVKKLENDSKFNASMKGRSPYVYERVLQDEAKKLAESQALEEFKSRMKKAGATKTNVTSTETKLAQGGMILGPGTPTSDSIPAFNKDTGQSIALSTGEYVLPADVTKILGKSYLDNLISNPNSLKRQAGGIIPGADSELARKLGLIDQVLNEAGLKREGSSLNIVKDISDGVSKSVSKESLSMIQNSLSQINEFAKKHNLSIPESTFSRSYVNPNSVSDEDFGVSSSLTFAEGGMIPGNKADDKQRELDKLIANIDTILGSGTGLKRQGFSLVEDSSSGIIGVRGSMAAESKSMIEATLAKAEDISKRYNVLPTPDPVPIIKASDVTDADFGVSSEMAMPTSNDASQFKFDRAAMLKDTETFQRQQGENLGLSSSQLVDPMREALTPMLDKQDATNQNMLNVLQNMLSVLESSTSIQSNMLNYARM